MEFSTLWNVLAVWVCWQGTSFAHQNVQYGQPPQQQHMHGHTPPATGQPQQFQQQGQGLPPPPGGNQNMFDKSQVQDRDHIKEHLEGVIQQPDTSKMTEQELQFHYFKMHDNDNNNKLDGCELIKSLIHWHETENETPDTNRHEPKILPDEELSGMVDSILEHDDTNDDGFLEWTEFLAAQSNV